MAKPKTNVVIILDKSGSMTWAKEATIAGYNDQLAAIKGFAKDQKVRVSRITFNENAIIDYWMEPVSRAAQLTIYNYSPTGSTALYDAVGIGINQAIAEEDPEAAYLFVIVSDGQENASRIWNAKALSTKIKSLQKTGRWTFTYIGANQDLARVSRDLNIPRSNMMAYHNDPIGTQVMYASSTASLSDNYFTQRSTTGAAPSAGIFNDVEEIAEADEETTTITTP